MATADWRLVWAEVYGELPCPELWAGVSDAARREICEKIEAKKKKGGGPKA